MVSAAVVAAPRLIAAAEKWKSVPPELLAEAAPRLEPTAAAEIVFADLEIDDRAFPKERKVSQYNRYKIFAPNQAEAITRMLVVESTGSAGRTEFAARLVLPNGQTREFGRKAIKEQTAARRAGEPSALDWLRGSPPELRERFLAIEGVEPGAVLDYRVTWTTSDPDNVETFEPQSAGVPIRRFNFICHTFENPQWLNRTYGFNLRGAKFEHDASRQLLTLTVSDLPTIRREPWLGPATDYTLTIKSCYERVARVVPLRGDRVSDPITVDPKLGPWAVLATMLDWFSADHAQPTERVKKLVAEITAKAADDEAKARAIHRHVTILSQKYRRRPGPHPKATDSAASLDDVLDLETKPTIKRPPEEFLWLAIALYRAAGLECRAAMLPDRSLVRFDQKEVGRTFLPDRAAAVRIGGSWRFSCPQNTQALPFGLLPWENEGEQALLGIERSVQFVPVASPPASASAITSLGTFAVAEDGTLTGELRRTFTGHAAVALRGRLRSANTKEKRATVVAESLGLNPKVVTIAAGAVSGVEDAELPLEVACTVRWPGYATFTKDRLILRGPVLQAENATPFPATERRHPVQFPYCWQNTDRLTIRLPEGFQAESVSPPPPLTGSGIGYALRVVFDERVPAVRVEREFSSSLIDVVPADYAKLKACYDHIARGDQQELVFVRRGATTKLE